MTTKEEFLKEIEEYSSEELELIYETQKDLYTVEEMTLIKERLEIYEKAEKEKIEKMLPKEIKCHKCDVSSSYSTSISDIVDLQFGHQLIILLPLYISPLLYNFSNFSNTAFESPSSKVNLSLV